MKNIHVLSTDKPSRLHKAFEKTFILSTEHTSANDLYKSVPHNIYITSDEQIKEGDWILNETHNIEKAISHYNYKSLSSDCKKIILTTDQDLIKDGVQAIDDDFLEWFIKNPSCDSVEILEAPKLVKMIDNEFYKIIIPKEEAKQETLEEAISRIKSENEHYIDEEAFELGAKWQQERIYSEEDIIEASKYGYNFHKTTQFPQQEFEDSCVRNTQQWLEQFKNK